MISIKYKRHYRRLYWSKGTSQGAWPCVSSATVLAYADVPRLSSLSQLIKYVVEKLAQEGRNATNRNPIKSEFPYTRALTENSHDRMRNGNQLVTHTKTTKTSSQHNSEVVGFDSVSTTAAHSGQQHLQPVAVASVRCIETSATADRVTHTDTSHRAATTRVGGEMTTAVPLADIHITGVGVDQAGHHGEPSAFKLRRTRCVPPRGSRETTAVSWDMAGCYLRNGANRLNNSASARPHTPPGNPAREQLRPISSAYNTNRACIMQNQHRLPPTKVDRQGT